MDMEEIYGHEILAMEKFCWVCDVRSWNFFFCGYDFGSVGIFCCDFGHVGIFLMVILDM